MKTCRVVHVVDGDTQQLTFEVDDVLEGDGFGEYDLVLFRDEKVIARFKDYRSWWIEDEPGGSA